MYPGTRNVLPDWLESAARSFPERVALTCASRHWRFAELLAATERATALLGSIWAGRDGRIGILAANRPGFVIAVHAARWLGVPIVPLNWRLGHEELIWQIQQSGVSLLLVDEERAPLAGSEPVERLSIALLEEPIDRASPTGAHRVVDLAGEAAVLFTSGTGGRPKGAMLTHGNFWHSAVGSMLHLGHRQDDRWLAALPLFHIGGLSIIVRGAIGAVSIDLQPRFVVDRKSVV